MHPSPAPSRAVPGAPAVRPEAAPDLVATLAGITAAVVAAVPGAAFAGITQATRPGRARARAPGDNVVDTLGRLQAELRQGPDVAALREQRTVAIPDLAHERRWPSFVARAGELGVGSMLCLHLYTQHRSLGTLALYATAPRAFTHDDETIAGVFAAHAAVALHAAEQRRDLTRAMASRDVIGQARGILMARHDLTADQAFGLLVRGSQHTNRELAVLARQLVNEETRTHDGAARPGVRAALAGRDLPPLTTTPPVGLRVRTEIRPIVVELFGEIDALTAPLLYGLLRLPKADVVVDLSGVTFLGAAGLALLLRLRTHLGLAGATLDLAGVAPASRRLIAYLGLAAVLPCWPTGRAAVDAGRARPIHRDPVPLTALPSGPVRDDLAGLRCRLRHSAGRTLGPSY